MGAMLAARKAEMGKGGRNALTGGLLLSSVVSTKVGGVAAIDCEGGNAGGGVKRGGATN